MTGELGQVGPGQSRTIPVPRSADADIAAGRFALSISHGDTAGDAAIFVYGKQFRGSQDNRAVGLWYYYGAPGDWRRPVNAGGRASTRIIPTATAILVRNESPNRPIELTWDIVPASDSEVPSA